MSDQGSGVSKACDSTLVVTCFPLWKFIPFLLIAFTLQVAAQDQDDEEPFVPGLIGTYTDFQNNTVQRVDRAVNFTWKNHAPDRRLDNGPFRAEWQGYLLSQANGPYQFHAFFAGRVRISLNGQIVLDGNSRQPIWQSSDACELSFDYHRLQIEFDQPSTSTVAQLALFWSGPQFQLEPITERQFFHDGGSSLTNSFERGAELVRALRCAACHAIATDPPRLAAPALDQLKGNLHRSWIVRWLTARSSSDGSTVSVESTRRRMPYFDLDESEADALAAYLLSQSKPPSVPDLPSVETSPPANATPPKDKAKTKFAKERTRPDDAEPPMTPIDAGRRLALTVGCAACHEFEGTRPFGLFGGGDLSRIAEKRPSEFFERWLANPSSVNKDHRMPVFELSGDERKDLSAFLSTLGDSSVNTERKGNASAAAQQINQGRTLFEKFQCGACHEGPEPTGAEKKLAMRSLTGNPNWTNACSNPVPNDARPAFRLDEVERRAIQEFVSTVNPRSTTGATAELALKEQNCLACHSRDESTGLAHQLTTISARYPELSPLVPAMSPPPLASVGDKLTDNALRDAIRGGGRNQRPYLMVRMPKFRLADFELETLVDGFISADRIPPDAPATNKHPNPSAEFAASNVLLETVGTRLVTSDGFGCVSCHRVGSVEPVKAPLNARGANLSMLGERIRKPWFERWVRNPSRIIPRMEMPSVQIPVIGVLNENLDAQLAAVWQILNRPGFEPPLPNPVRVLRHSGSELDQPAHVVTDVVRARQGNSNFTKPLLVGLSNRHNILFDLETSRLAAWSIGDLARQRTEGKAWFWESAGRELLVHKTLEPEITLFLDDDEYAPQRSGQFVTEFDEVRHVGTGIQFAYRLHFADSRLCSDRVLHVTQTFRGQTSSFDNVSGIERTVEIRGVQAGVEVRLRVLSDKGESNASRSGDHTKISLGNEVGQTSIQIIEPEDAVFDDHGVVRSRGHGEQVIRFKLAYFTNLVVDRHPLTESTPVELQPRTLDVVPGFDAFRLPLSDEIMPTALAWRSDATMFIASLKGQIFVARDGNRDGVVDTVKAFSDDLAAPYGLYATNEYVDVVNKYAVLRLFDDDHDDQADRTVTVASGWGHTADYHDWAVGLPRDESGNYYVALPCQQDGRSKPAAHLRGEFLRLTPRMPTKGDPRLYSLEQVSRGHRFPMGIARNRGGEIFVTDNQGNYNPFNELNHIRQGAHFGFINSIDAKRPRPTDVAAPAINIPHPWTRSVNGICFLDTPGNGEKRFGPFEGDLIGCEYDTRRLIRMTLQKVGETWQGAAYPFSYDKPPSGAPLLGPIVSAVSPDGDLYIGGLRDSGWGAANNIGEVVRLRLNPTQMVNGIAEMRAINNGFVVEYIGDVRAEAEQIGNYSLVSYKRESTPEYGGADIDRRTERIVRVSRLADRRTVALELGQMRAGYVYELHVQGITSTDRAFFPTEAHYTLNVVP